MNAITQHSFFLTADGLGLSASCFVPDDVRGAVLFIPPFVEERKGALPAFVQMARSLAEDRIASLLFDLPGCGDSEGDFATVSPECFERACDAAADWLARAFPSAPLALLGVRTGAVLALRAAAKHPTVQALALWSPVEGPDFVRQLLQRRMVNDMVAYGKARESRASLEARLRAGETVDLDGYALSGPFYAWLQTLAVQPSRAPAFLVSGGHDAKCADACAAACPRAVRTELRFPPFWNTVGHVDLAPLISETRSWLAARFDQGPSSASAWPALQSETRTAALCEFSGIRAALDTPRGEPRAGVLFLHGWSGDRTGPHRLFVRLARQLADAGVLCLRPDFFGRGLSDGASADASIALMTRDACAALEALRARLPPNAPTSVVAICSGCKVAVSLAADHPEIARLALWSAESMGSLRSSATDARKTSHALLTYARKLMRPETWKKILSGKVRTDLVAKALVKHETRSADEARSEDETLKRFRSFRNPVLFVFGGSDPDAAGSSRAYADYCRKNAIPHELHTVAYAGHSYYGEEWTRELIDVSRSFLHQTSPPY